MDDTLYLNKGENVVTSITVQSLELSILFFHCIKKQPLLQTFPKNKSHGNSMTKHRLLLDKHDSTAETLKGRHAAQS